MLVAADVRNGSVAIGAREARAGGGYGPWLARFRLAAAERTSEEWTYLMRAMLRDAGVDPSAARTAALSSAVPAFTERFRRALRALVPAEPLVVGPGVRTGLRIRTENPQEVGADLVCNAAAALRLVSPPCVVVDMGTVLTLTALDGKGDLVGVSIAPGLEAAAAALRERAAQLPQVRLAPPQRAIGRNTAESVRSGLVLGWAGLLDRLVEAIGAELGAPGAALVGTGDALEPLLEPGRGFSAWEPFLALDGLAAIAELNAAGL